MSRHVVGPGVVDDAIDATRDEVEGDEGNQDDTAPKAGSSTKRRTKTGCLTCRRRRIKCGEEKPTCGNCVKSKRHCEGYNQRVVFKDPVITWQTSGTSSNSQRQFHIHQNQTSSESSIPKAVLPKIQPKPIQDQNAALAGSLHVARASVTANAASQQKNMASINVEKRTGTVPRESEAQTNASTRRQLDSSLEKLYTSDNQWAASDALLQSYKASQNWPIYLAQQAYSSPHSKACIGALQTESTLSTHDSDPRNHGVRQTTNRDSRSTLDQDSKADELYDSFDSIPNQPTTAYLHQDMDDDLYDISEGETMNDLKGDVGDDDSIRRDSILRDEELGVILSKGPHSGQGNYANRLRTYHSVIDYYGPDMLTSYRPSAQDSPLNDATSAQIFHHFINVLGPSISTNERNPANPSVLLQGRQVPLNQQHLWTYTMPKLAIQEPALLHAMLAVSSFHIAKLRDIPVTASWKHYHISIRRVARNVSSPTKRVLPSTLGAVMLLGFYELMSAEHQKWSDHLLGASQLIRQVEFWKVANYIKARKTEKRRLQAQLYHHELHIESTSLPYDNDTDDYIDPVEEDVDEDFIGLITGEEVAHDQRGRAFDDMTNDFPDGAHYTKQDIANYETQRDLFWWYCKQDVYQSFLSGNKLFMAYPMWRDCLPRAPIGRLHAIYGTFDHVILLFGRVTDFAAKDLKRKKQLLQANGGQWRPPVGVQVPGPPPPPDAGFAPPRSSSIPMFPGMMPDTGKQAKLPRGFSPPREQTPESSESTESNLERRTREAEERWKEIRASFQVLADALGPDFQALGEDHVQTITSVFGEASQFRTYGVASVWLNFYMALIALYRAHPDMPPAALMAAGISAKHTAIYAMQIGRIAAGIVEDTSSLAEVNTQIGASLIEATLALFMAGVQFYSQAQRQWTIQRLLDITRLTGWQTGAAIAVGLETSWVKAAEMGRGPPYTRAADAGAQNDLSDQSRRRLDGMLQSRGESSGRMVVSKQERVHYVLGILGVEEDFQRLELPDQ